MMNNAMPVQIISIKNHKRERGAEIWVKFPKTKD